MLRVRDPVLAQLLQHHGLAAAGDIVQAHVADLAETLGLSYSKARELQELACQQVAPRAVTAAQMHKDAAARGGRVLLGLPALDTVLSGGLPPGLITELVGPSSAGKTQLCMSALLHARSVIVIDTELKFNAARLSEMARARFFGEHAWSDDDPETRTALEHLLGRVLIVRCADTQQLMHALYGLQTTVAAKGAALVVLDSMAAPVRAEFDASKAALTQRAELLGQAAACLKAVAESCHVPVLVTNQVSARVSRATTGHDFQAGGLPLSSVWGDMSGEVDGHASAALGTAWAHSVNVRIILEREGARRRLQLIKCPTAPNVAVEFQIGQSGVQQVGLALPAAMQGSVLGAPISNQAFMAPDGAK